MNDNGRIDPYEDPKSIGRYRVENLLGKGTFGNVYLADDPRLQRHVAIKVPHRALVASPEDAEAYLTEARIVAKLKHPHIVGVYDVGNDDLFPCFFVLEHIKGGTLAQQIKTDRPLVAETLELVITVADTLHFAHKAGIVHRDVKPGNILLDERGPVVGDFGLALREQDIGKGPQYAGTLAYMSPEQARGEGHRVDGRSDIFGLGIVFYELLTGHRPFRGDSRAELLEQITRMEARPPRQWDDTIPRELERICLKALAKRATERYSTAQDMASELRSFLEQSTMDEKLLGRSRAQSNADAAAAAPADSALVHSGMPTVVGPAPAAVAGSKTGPISEQQSLMISPRGLRSFDAHDAVFFLELLPGPRDRNGVPDSIRFWKTRIEEKDPESTFSVGLIYGPSGCGKSSLVKAGLLPRLSSDVIPVYVEATGDETETRLLNGLRKKCPDLPSDLSLIETLTAARQGHGVPPFQKLLIVLDQFEQWLHAKKGQEDTELVRALRQCDGGHVQCIVMVRDDFWLAVCRFLQELEVRLVEGQNSALVDLFPLQHAKKVLAAYGRAFSALPESTEALTKEQKQFLDQAVQGLAQDNKVICVRLALFSEMMKSRSWTPSGMKEVGGAEGVGVAFLDETFAASTAPPHHRYHQNAARAVLKALLPEGGTDIKGHMRSADELLTASGYADRPRDFADLLRILDGELRLITPIDPEGVESFSRETAASAQSALAEGSRLNGQSRSYQLTHDYLVPSLREWLTRKQKETWRGRAELQLADRAALWGARPENRQLPSLVQWLRIRALTSKKDWNAGQRRMMDRAARWHLRRGAIAAVCLLLLSPLAWEIFGRWRAHELCARLLVANTAEVPSIVDEMSSYRRWADPLLRKARADAENQDDDRRQLRASLALLPVDYRQADYLHECLLQGDLEEVAVIRQALADKHVERSDALWAILQDRHSKADRRLRAACALALFESGDERWPDVSPDVANILMGQKKLEIARWADLFDPIERWIAKKLTQEPSIPNNEQARVELAESMANMGTALVLMGHDEVVWPLLKQSPYPTLRSLLIDGLCPAGVRRDLLMARLERESDDSVRKALIQALGQNDPDGPPRDRASHVSYLLDLYENDPDPGIHSAAQWTLRRLDVDDTALAAIDSKFKRPEPEGKRRWYVNRQGLTMMVLQAPAEFARAGGNRIRLGRRFALAATDVTVEQFRRFCKNPRYNETAAPEDTCPMIDVSWYRAAEYCNWLSREEGLPDDQWCYLPNANGKFAEGMKMAPDYLHRSGYRLPSTAEWEWAYGPEAMTMHSFGESPRLREKYGWFSSNRTHPVARLQPNEYGLYDMLGNCRQWMLDRAMGPEPRLPGDQEDQQDLQAIVETGQRYNYGISYYDSASWRANQSFSPSLESQFVGIRVARTMPK